MSTHLRSMTATLALLALCGMLVTGCAKKEEAPAAATPEAAAGETPDAAAEAAAPAPAPAAPAKFDLASVPLSSATLPPFPYLDWPPAVPANDRYTELKKDFDGITLIAGREFRAVEGRVERRSFSIPKEMSQLEVRRNYANLIQQLGGVQIQQVKPTTSSASISTEAKEIAGPDVDVANLLGLSRYDEGKYEYESYVIRTADTTAWIVVQTSQYSAVITVVAEKAMTQSVGFVSADAMKQALAATGRIALQVNFDTDAATLRPDAAPVMAEIVKLLSADPALKLRIEGHTDNSGTAQRNTELSRQRAEAVTAALVAAGIDKARLTSAGFGQDRPVADNATEAGRAQNRRVELVKT